MKETRNEDRNDDIG